MIYNCQFAAGQIEMAKFHQRSGNGRHRDRGRLGLATALAEFFCGRGMRIGRESILADGDLYLWKEAEVARMPKAKDKLP
jgi:hypothetical protein